MSNTLEDTDWEILLTRINAQKCTPFLGAGACYGTLPLGSTISRKWAKKYKYPLTDCDDLSRVAQFLAVEHDHMFPKERIAAIFKKVPPPDFDEPDEPHGILAELSLPIYITTNYDDFMTQALKAKKKKAELVLCQWNKLIKDYIENRINEYPSISELKRDFTPTPKNPLVFHFHGYKEMTESLVLTEDDYLDFLVNISRSPTLLPHQIKRALTGTSLIFIGYRLADWDFRVLFQGLINSMENSLRRLSIAVQLPPGNSASEKKESQKYLTKYFNSSDVRVFWGTAKEFAVELRKRWKNFKGRERENDTSIAE